MQGLAGPGEVAGLMRRGRAARLDGDDDGARAAFAKAFELAREQRDPAAMGQAALGLAGGYVSGTHFGRVPAFLFEAHGLATGITRTRLAVALARALAYPGDTGPAMPVPAQ